MMTEPDTWILDVTAVTFEKEVIQRSRSVPVLVDFWATWCKPCKTLTPTLEALAREGKGRFVLAKVDLETNPELGQALRVEAVPAVFAIVDGRVADAFQGALPRAEIEAFLDKIAPQALRQPSIVDAADERVAADDREGAIRLLRDHLRGQAEDGAARLRLTEVLIDLGQTGDATLALEKLAADASFTSQVAALRSRIELAESAGGIEQLRRDAAAAPEDAAARSALGRGLTALGDHEGALSELLEAVRLDTGDIAREAKQAMLAIFEERGLEDPLANEYRFKLSLELFS